MKNIENGLIYLFQQATQLIQDQYGWSILIAFSDDAGSDKSMFHAPIKHPMINDAWNVIIPSPLSHHPTGHHSLMTCSQPNINNGYCTRNYRNHDHVKKCFLSIQKMTTEDKYWYEILQCHLGDKRGETIMLWYRPVIQFTAQFNS